jgi:hypothetical protein
MHPCSGSAIGYADPAAVVGMLEREMVWVFSILRFEGGLRLDGVKYHG